MITLPIWAASIITVLVAAAMYFLGSMHGEAKGRRVSWGDGHYQGYYDGYADCLVRTRSCEQTVESEACDAQ